MRKIIFILLMSFAGLTVFSQNYNLNISGTVTTEDGTPVVQKEVFINIPGDDSLNRDFYYFNTVFTDGSGYYEDNIEVPEDEDGEAIVETFGCQGYMLSQSDDFSENNNVLVFDFEICNDSVGDDCQAMFDYYPNDVPLTLAFTDMSYGDPDEWSWDFGDGESSVEQNPIHTYGAEGEYFVTLEISGDDGDCSSVYEMPVYVGNDSIWQGECMAMFCYFPDDSISSLTMVFTDMSMGLNGLPPTSWDWTFGDGTGSTEQNPIHTYGSDGDYEVCLTITSEDSATGETCEDTFCGIVSVIDWDNYCEAWFYYYPEGDSNNPNGGMTFQFIDESWGDPDTWVWEFGDGTSSGDQNPLHTYADEGIYQVCLTIYNDADTCESTFCEELWVGNDTIGNCFTWFEYDIDDLTVDYTAYYGGDGEAQYTWEFGDGTTGAGEIVEHTYAEDGIYDVILTAYSGDGSCVTTYTESVWVGDDFSFSIYGNVYLEDSLMADFADVYLMTFDTMGNDLISVATTQVDANGYYEFEEVGLENCMYFVQAELTDASAYFDDYIPTYHLSAMNWEEAWPVFPMPMGYASDIYMIADSNVVNGNGNIDGVVESNENRGLLSEVLILLQDENGIPLTYLRTDANGEFEFPELEYGTYIVYTEIVGIETTPAVVTLSQENPTASIKIVVANGEATLGLDKHSAFIGEVGMITPNPVADNAKVEISLKESSVLTLMVVNQYGQTINTSVQEMDKGKNEIAVNTASLPQGVYLLNIVAEDGVKTVRKFVKLR